LCCLQKIGRSFPEIGRRPARGGSAVSRVAAAPSESIGTAFPEHVPKKLIDFFDQNMLPERFLFDQMSPSDQEALRHCFLAGTFFFMLIPAD
jgi:hypothetical protein